MNGIEILSAATRNELQIGWLALLTVGGCFIGFVVFLLIERDYVELSPLGGLLGVAIGLLVYFAIFEGMIPKQYTEYKVTVSDEVAMTEFLEKYEIIETEGLIYTVKERETE